MSIIIIIIVIIIGFLFGQFIYFNFFNIEFHGPNSNIIRKNIYKFNDKYYQFIPQLCIGHKLF